MEEYLSALYEFYITPNIEDDEYLKSTSALLQELKPAHAEQCQKVLELCACKAFLLGVRTGVKLEQFLT